MKEKNNIQRVCYFLLFVSFILLLIGLFIPLCSAVSALLAIITACISLSRSSKMEKTMSEYDNAFQTRYNSKGEIEEIRIDCGTY